MAKIVPFSVVWLKRDLRLRDHQPLLCAYNLGLPVALLYVVEPIMLKDRHMDLRHWRFNYQSLVDLNQQLSNFNTRIHVLNSDIISSQLSKAESPRSHSTVSNNNSGLSLRNTFLSFATSHLTNCILRHCLCHLE